YAEATRRLVLDHYSEYEGEDLLEIMVAENVLTQIDNLRTYPVIHSKLYQKQIKIYAWIYQIETGEVLAYDPESHAYTTPQSQVNEYEGEEVTEPVIDQSNYENLGFPMTRLSREQMNRIYQGSN
ncbi:MAG: carbonic anhydrase, partial [Cyanobacteria bacterium J06629_18]